jgi:hypothetical protein
MGMVGLKQPVHHINPHPNSPLLFGLDREGKSIDIVRLIIMKPEYISQLCAASYAQRCGLRITGENLINREEWPGLYQF